MFVSGQWCKSRRIEGGHGCGLVSQLTLGCKMMQVEEDMKMQLEERMFASLVAAEEETPIWWIGSRW